MEKKKFDDFKLSSEIKLIYCKESIKIYNISSSVQPTKDELEQLINDRPKEKVTGNIYGHEFEFPRYIQTFDIDYKFSGKLHTSEKIEDNSIPSKLLNYTKLIMNNDKYNGVMAEYYMNGSDKLNKHSDSRIKVSNGTYTIWFWFGATRFLRIYGKNSKELHSIKLECNTMIVFPNDMQTNYKHQIPESSEDKSSVCISVRAFD